MHIGIVGLGRMGMGMARRLHKAGHEVVAYNRSQVKVQQAKSEGMTGVEHLEDMVRMLPHPRVVLVMLPAGEVTEAMITILSGLLEAEDVLIDGGNSYWKDSVRRGETLARLGIHFLDQGTSGGLLGEERGYCLMVGGDTPAFALAEPYLRDLSMSGGYGLVGPVGSGHFAKMVHNGIEYGMMESLAEGMDLLQAGPFQKPDILQLTTIWRHGSIISSLLLDVLVKELEDHPDLDHVSASVADSGEGRWAITEAMERGVPFGAISEALFSRYASRRTGSFAGKVLSAMRLGFGGHKD